MKIKLPSFIKFAMSSGTSALIDMSVFSLMCFLLRDKGLGPVYLTIATCTARVISASFNYTVNYLLVFKSKETVLSTLPKYAINSACIMCASSFLVSTIHPLVSNIFSIVAGNELFVKIPVDITLFFVNYLIQSRLIYKAHKNTDHDAAPTSSTDDDIKAATPTDNATQTQDDDIKAAAQTAREEDV